MTGSYENANNAARAKYAAENPQLQKFLQLLFSLTGSDYNKQPDDMKAMWAQIASMLAPALAGTLGFDPGFATNRYDRLNDAVLNSGPIHVTGSRLANGATKNYGYAYGAGNITVAATQGLLGKIEKQYSGGDADIMAALMGDYMMRNGTGDLVKNIDLGNGTSTDAMHNLENAYRTTQDGKGTMGLEDAKMIDSAIITKQALDKKAWRMMKEAGMDVGEFDETKNYYGSQEFKSYNGGALYRQLDEEVKANGGVDVMDAAGKVTRHGMEDVEMAKAISAGGGSMNYINQAVFDKMSNNVKENFKALKEASEKLGMTIGEIEQFAKQTNMGALSGKRTVENIKAWTKRTEDIAAASGKTIKEVLQDQQNIADSLSGTGVTVTADKVLALQRHRESVLANEGKGGSIHTAEERTTMATRAIERASENNRGLYVARALRDSEFVDAETKAEAAELQSQLEDPNLTFQERARINKRLDAIAKKSGIDVSDPAVRRDLEARYNKMGDLDRTIAVNARNNVRNYVTKGAIGSKLRETYGIDMDDDVVEAAMAYENAAANGSASGDRMSSKKNMDMWTEKLAELDPEKREARARELVAEGLLTEQEAAAAVKMAGLSSTKRAAARDESNYNDRLEKDLRKIAHGSVGAPGNEKRAEMVKEQAAKMRGMTVESRKKYREQLAREGKFNEGELDAMEVLASHSEDEADALISASENVEGVRTASSDVYTAVGNNSEAQEELSKAATDYRNADSGTRERMEREMRESGKSEEYIRAVKHVSELSAGEQDAVFKIRQERMYNHKVEEADEDIMALFNAVGQDTEDQAGTKEIFRMARELRGKGTESEKEAYIKQLAEEKGLDKYQIEAVRRFSERTDEEMNAAAGLYHGAIKNGDTFNIAESGHEREKNRQAIDQDARRKRVELAEGATNSDKQKSMLQQFASGFFGEDDMSKHDVNMALLVKAEQERNMMINEAGGDTEKIEQIKKMGVADLLNHATSRMGFKEGEGPAALAAGSVEVMEDVFDKDSKLTDKFKDKVRNDDKVKKWMEDNGKTFEDIETDEEYLEAYEQAHGGSIEFTGVNGQTGKGTAVFMSDEATEYGGKLQRSIADKYKDAVEAWKGAGGIENNVTFDSNGNVEGLDVVDYKRYAEDERYEEDEYELDENGEKTDNLLHKKGEIKHKKGEIIRDSLGNAIGMERHHVDVQELLKNPELGGRDKDGNLIFDESDFQRNENGEVTGLSQSGLKKYGEHASEVTQAMESAQGDAALPQWLQDNIVKMCEDTGNTSSLLSSVIKDNKVQVDD